MKLNVQQQAVVEAIDGVWVVIAGPGSGKTHCLVERHLNMLSKGISHKDILNLSFTNAAATEMVNRVGLVNAEQIFRTFHSYALDLMKRERRFVPFQMTDEIIPVRGEDYQLLFELVDIYKSRGVTNFRTLQTAISSWKRDGIEPEQALREAVGREYYLALAYEEYEKKCRERGWLDFDSLIREAVRLLETNEEVRNRNKKKYISVDECQDTDVLQFRLLQLLFNGNILVVGDENQCIYEWRSAQSGNLSNFARLFPGAKTLYLGKNYRSTKRLVEFFKFILPVDNGIASHMITENDEGKDPILIQYPDTDIEIRRVLDKAVEDPENSVIIARTNRQLFDVQRIAAARNIKYKNLGKKDFWEQNEVKVLLNLAKTVNQQQDASSALRQIIADNNLYYRYRDTGDLMNSDPIENLNNVVKLAAQKNMNVTEFLNYIRKLTYGRKSRKEKDLTLATVHQAKGREWDNVFIIGAEQGIMPHKNGELPEEKRIFFVACSRAAKHLHISWSGSKSMFLEDVPFKFYEPEEDSVERSNALFIH
ncbi:MAG TPA: ATP-dependent helicase [Candidatus Paceibacterota bacterium]|jgi:DNA helicase-2/ATP-dependent DNA helicase PcrA|nr:ATP-dependent helicase [Candidatus Paceibacterota bacterium]